MFAFYRRITIEWTLMIMQGATSNDRYDGRRDIGMRCPHGPKAASAMPLCLLKDLVAIVVSFTGRHVGRGRACFELDCTRPGSTKLDSTRPGSMRWAGSGA